MKILFAIDQYSPNVGGAERLFESLCEGLVAALGADGKVYVLTSYIRGAPRLEVKNGVYIRRIGFAGRAGFSFAVFPIARHLARCVDLVHTSSGMSALPAFFAASAAKKPCTITIHEVWGDLWRKFIPRCAFLKKAEYFSMRQNYARYFCVSHATASALRNAIPSAKNKTEVIYPGISGEFLDHAAPLVFRAPSHPCGEVHGAPSFLFFGRPGISKGVEDLLAAWERVAEARPNARLILLLAKNPAMNFRRIQEKIKHSPVSSSISLKESVSQRKLVEHIQSCDAVVIPSLSEGFGFSAAEAASCGKPIIARRVGSLPEILADYPHVSFFEKQSELTGHLMRFEPSKPFSDTALAAAARFSNKFTVSGMVEKYMRAFRKVIDANK